MMSCGSQTPTRRATADVRGRRDVRAPPGSPSEARLRLDPAAPRPERRRHVRIRGPAVLPATGEAKTVPRADDHAAVDGAGREVGPQVRTCGGSDVHRTAGVPPRHQFEAGDSGAVGLSRHLVLAPMTYQLPLGRCWERSTADRITAGDASRWVGRWPAQRIRGRTSSGEALAILDRNARNVFTRAPCPSEPPAAATPPSAPRWGRCPGGVPRCRSV